MGTLAPIFNVLGSGKGSNCNGGFDQLTGVYNAHFVLYALTDVHYKLGRVHHKLGQTKLHLHINHIHSR